MGLFDRLRGELVDIVEWIDDSQHTLVWRFPRYQNQIKNGAQLLVRPGQKAVFVDQGQIADVFEPGRYELTTDNLPLLSSLRAWKHGFQSPFKCEVYFISTRQITDLKWGTPNPIMLRDADFGPIRLRAFGTYALRALNAPVLLRELVGTDGRFETEEVGQLLRSLIVEAFTDQVGESRISALDLASNYRELSEALRRKVSERIDDEYGLELPALFIVNVSLPPEVEKALDTRAQMGVLGDLQQYQQFQLGQAMTAAASNPGGGAAGAGLGLGLGMAMAHQMMPGGVGFAAARGGVGGTQAGGGGADAGLVSGVPAGSAPPPPPPPSEPLFHITQGGQTFGPVPASQLRQSLAQRALAPQVLVWTPGMAGWTPAAEVPSLQPSPPPPPAAPPAPPAAPTAPNR